MADPFRRVSVGEPLVIPASAWNATLDAAEAYRSLQEGIDRARVTSTPLSVLAHNATGVDVPRFGVVSLEQQPAILPSENPEEFQRRIVSYVINGPNSYAGVVGVAQAPIAAGTIGSVLVSGVTAVQIDVLVSGTADAYADIVPGVNTHVQSRTVGGRFSILWVEPGLGMRWGYILLQRAGGPVTPVTLVAMNQFAADAHGYVFGHTVSWNLSTRSWDYPYLQPPTVLCLPVEQGIVPMAYRGMDQAFGVPLLASYAGVEASLYSQPYPVWTLKWPGIDVWSQISFDWPYLRVGSGVQRIVFTDPSPYYIWTWSGVTPAPVGGRGITLGIIGPTPLPVGTTETLG